MCNVFTGDVVSSSKSVNQLVTLLRGNFNQYKNMNKGLRVLIYDSDPIQLLQYSKSMAFSGWETHTISDVQEILDVDISNYHLVVIDDSANRLSINVDDIDIAELVTFKGHDMGIIALTSSFGQKESSIYFTGSVTKPLIESSVLKLREMAIDTFYKVLLSVDIRSH